METIAHREKLKLSCFEMFAMYYFKTAQTEVVDVPVGNHLRLLNNKSRGIYNYF